MIEQGFGFSIKWEEGDKITSMPITADAMEYLNGIFGKSPEEYIKEYINDSELYNKVKKAYDEAEKKAIPKDLDCKFCKGESINSDDKACNRYYFQMGITYSLASTEFVNIVERNKHLYNDKKFLRKLTAGFISCFYFYEGKGVVWFDLPKLQNICLSQGFLSISETLRQSDIFQTLVKLNDTLDSINTSLVCDQLKGTYDPNMLIVQKKFFEDKMTYFERKLKIIQIQKENNKKVRNKESIEDQKPSVPEYALYYYYMQKAKDLPHFENHIHGKLGAIEELIENGEIETSAKYFQIEYNKIANYRTNRIAINKIKSIEYVIDKMLIDYPNAKKLAIEELELAKSL